MATKRRKQRIEKKIIRAFDKGKDSKSLVFTKRLEGITTREGNRAIGNTKLQRGLDKIVDPLRNVAGLPARSLSANVSQAFPKANIKVDSSGKIIPTGSIQSPESAIKETRDKIVYGPTGKPSTGVNSQNIGLLESNLSPATVASSSKGGSGSIDTPRKPVVVNEPATSSVDFTQQTELPIEALVKKSNPSESSARISSLSGGSSIFGGNAPASTGGIQLNPDGSTALGSDFSYALTPEQRAEEEARKKEQEYYKKEARQKVDRESIMQDALRQFQGEIDAVNAVFADKISQAKLEGADRLGSDRAANFNAGAVNSTFGEASKQRVLEFNRSKESAINNEKLNLISQINSAARALGDKFYAEKKAAKEAGLESYMASLLSSKEAKTAIAEEIATNIISANLTPDNMTEKQLKEIARNAGVSVELIKNSFTTVKTELETAKAEADRKARIEGQFTLGKDQVRYDAYGNVIGRGVSTSSPGDGTFSAEVLALAQDVNSGALAPEKVPSALRGQVALALKTLPDPRINELDYILQTIDELAANPKLDNILGPVDQAIGGKFGEAATAKNLYNQLTGILALEGRQKLKGSGAISDFEFKVLKEAQSALGRNLNLTEFNKQLEKVRGVLEDRKNFLEASRGGSSAPTKTIEDYRLEFPQATEEELQALYEEEQASFSQVGSDTYNAESIANAIKQVESQGNYQARGASGETGAYQFMPNTWRQWAGEFLGDPNAPQTPENQDYVAMAKIDSLLKQGYNPAEIALIWNGGTPTVKRGVNKYGVAYDSGAYANKVLKALG